MLNLETCPTCNSTNLLESLEPTGNIYYGRLTCDDCKRFVRWIPKPKVPKIAVARLLHGTGLEAWEKKFLKAIACRSPSKAEAIVI